MFKSLSDAVLTFLGFPTNDNKIPPVSKRKRHFDENYKTSFQISVPDKRRRLDMESNKDQILSRSTLRGSSGKSADLIKPKHNFNREFNVKHIDSHSKWREKVAADKNNGSFQVWSKDSESRVLMHPRSDVVSISGLNGKISNGVPETLGNLHAEENCRQPHSPMFHKRSQPCMISKCIRLNEKAEYQKLLQLQCSQLFNSQRTGPMSHRVNTSLLGAKDTDVVTVSSRSSSCDMSTTSVCTPSRVIPQSKYANYRENASLSVLSEEPQSKIPLLNYYRPFSVFNSKKDVKRRSLAEINHKNEVAETIVIDDDNEDDEHVRHHDVSRSTCVKRDAEKQESQDLSKSRLSFQQSKYFNDKEMEDEKQRRQIERERRNRLIEDEEMKVSAYREKRRAQEISLEKQLKYQMRIFEEEPEVSEDIFLEEEEEEKEEVMPVLTDDMERTIDYALRPGNPEEVLSEAFRLQIRRKDIATLKGLNWLNDEIINFYMNLLMERGEKSGRKIYAFNTFFYPKIISGGHSSVKRWTKNVDIFSKQYIIIPVHMSMHWCLCVVDMEKKAVTYYDSMGGKNKHCLNAVMNYLRDESAAKNQTSFNEKEWLAKHAEDNPQQMNGSDCGMFMCKYADYITRGKDISFTQEHMPYFRRRMVYEIVSKQLLQ